MLPLTRVLPRAIDWHIRSRAFRWYRELRAIEREAAKLTAVDTAAHAALQRRLDHMESRVLNTSMPLSRSDLLYNLRQHLELVRARLAASRPSSLMPGREQGRG